MDVDDDDESVVRVSLLQWAQGSQGIPTRLQFLVQVIYASNDFFLNSTLFRTIIVIRRLTLIFGIAKGVVMRSISAVRYR